MAFGDIVLDELLGVNRADVADVLLFSNDVTVGDIRTGLGLRPDQRLSIQNAPPRRVCSIDQIVILDDGRLVNSESEQDIAVGARVNCELLDTDLQREDVVRLYRWMRRYPEVAFDQALRMRVRADFVYLLSVAGRDPDIEMLLYAEVWERGV